MAEVRIDIIEDYKDTGAYRKLEGNASSAMAKLKTAGDTVKAAWLEITLIIGAVAAAYNALSAGVDTAQKLAEETRYLQMTTGMMAEEASTMIAVADQMGISYDTLQNAVTAVARKMGGLKDIESEVAEETGAAADVFDKFGITVKNADGTIKPFSDVFSQIKDRIQSTTNETEQLAIATQFFRGSAAQLMPLLTMTDQEFKELAADAKRYGLVLTQDNVAAAKAYTMAQRDLDDAFTGLKLVIGQALIPVLTTLAKWVANEGANIINFARGVKDFVGSAFEFWFGAAQKTTGALEKNAQAQQASAAAAQENAQKMASTAKVLESYAAVVEKIGEAKLKMAGDQFSTTLKEESDSITKMKAGLTTYLDTVSQVYAARYSGEMKIQELMKQTNDPGKVAAQQARIMQVEQQSAMQRLGAWQQYYTALEQRYNANVQAMMATTNQINALDDQMYQQQWTYYDMVAKLRQTDMSASYKYYDDLRILGEKYQAAQALDGEARVKMLQSIQQQWMTTVGEVKEGDQTIVSSSQTVWTAYDNITKIQDDITAAQQQMKSAAEDSLSRQIELAQNLAIEMSSAKGTIEELKMRVMELDAELSRQKILQIDTAGAVAGINQVKTFLDSIPAVTYKTVVMQFQTQASPIMPFTEGMNHIKDMLDALPQGSEFTVKFNQLAAEWQRSTALAERVTGYEKAGMNVSYDALKQRDEAERKSNDIWAEMLNLQKEQSRKPSGPAIGTYAPQFTVQATTAEDGKALAKELDKRMADDIRFGRSATLVALKQVLGL